MWHWFTMNRRKGKQRATGFSPRNQFDDYECSRAKMVHGFCANSKFSNTTNGRESQELTLESKRRSMCNLFAVYQQSNCQVLPAMTDDRERTSPAMALPVKNESPIQAIAARVWGAALGCTAISSNTFCHWTYAMLRVAFFLERQRR